MTIKISFIFKCSLFKKDPIVILYLSIIARLEGKKRVERDKQIYQDCQFSQQYKWQKDNRHAIINNLNYFHNNHLNRFYLLFIIFLSFFNCIGRRNNLS